VRTGLLLFAPQGVIGGVYQGIISGICIKSSHSWQHEALFSNADVHSATHQHMGSYMAFVTLQEQQVVHILLEHLQGNG
jgi:hypothetical protein